LLRHPFWATLPPALPLPSSGRNNEQNSPVNLQTAFTEPEIGLKKQTSGRTRSRKRKVSMIPGRAGNESEIF